MYAPRSAFSLLRTNPPKRPAIYYLPPLLQFDAQITIRAKYLGFIYFAEK